MTKTKQAEYNVRFKLGFDLEWAYSPRGKKLVSASKPGFKTVWATNLISLEKLLTNNQ